MTDQIVRERFRSMTAGPFKVRVYPHSGRVQIDRWHHAYGEPGEIHDHLGCSVEDAASLVTVLTRLGVEPHGIDSQAI